MPNPENLKPFKKGYDERRNLKGVPRKYINTLKENGYTQQEVKATVMVLMSMNLQELSEIWNNKQSDTLLLTLAGAIKRGIEKGSIYTIQQLLEMVFGKPKETSQVTTDGKIEVVFTQGKTIL